MSDNTRRNFPGHGNLNVIELMKLSTADIVKLYNAKADKPLKSTPTKGKIAGRLFDMYKDSPAKVTDGAKSDGAKKEKAPKTPASRLTLDFAPTVPADERKQANRGSRMEALLVMASRKNGVDEQELKSATKAKDRFRAMVMWANEGLGWGFKEIEAGRVVLVDGAGHLVEYTPRTHKEKE